MLRSTAVLTLALLLLGGCVERRMYFTSRPAGCEVYIDGQYAGKTPLRIPFAHYGTHQITWRDPEHVSVSQPWTLTTPVYQWFPLDFFTEWLLPLTLVDEQRLDLQLEPTPAVTAERLQGLRKRAEALRVDGNKPGSND